VKALWFCALLLMVRLAPASATSPPPLHPVPDPQSPPSAGAATEQAPANAASTVVEPYSEVERAVAAKLEPRYDKMLRDARAEDERLRGHLSVLVAGIEYGLVVLSIILTGLAAFGFNEFRNVRKLRKEANKARVVSESITSNMEIHLRKAVETGVQAAWEAPSRTFADLPTISDQPLASSPPPAITPETMMMYEEADILLVLADRLTAISNQEQGAAFFIKLARYWWLVENWPRAIARSLRAVELAPKSIEAHLMFSSCLFYKAIHSVVDADEKKRLLTEATAHAKTAQQLQKNGNNSLLLYRLGFIADEMEDYAAAKSYYRQAIDAEGRGADTLVTRFCKYNIACSLTKEGNLSEALKALSAVINRDDNWRYARTDPDLLALRESKTMRDEFFALLHWGLENSR
jgi:hypothetical protein